MDMTPPDHFEDYKGKLIEIANDQGQDSVAALLKGQFGEPQVGDYAYAAEKLMDNIATERGQATVDVMFGKPLKPLSDKTLGQEQALNNILPDVRHEFTLRTGIEPKTDIPPNTVETPDGTYKNEPLENHAGSLSGQFALQTTYAEHTSFMKDPQYAKGMTEFNDFIENNTASVISINIPTEPAADPSFGRNTPMPQQDVQFGLN